jgi:hypothetical protein
MRAGLRAGPPFLRLQEAGGLVPDRGVLPLYPLRLSEPGAEERGLRFVTRDAECPQVVVGAKAPAFGEWDDVINVERRIPCALLMIAWRKVEYLG